MYHDGNLYSGYTLFYNDTATQSTLIDFNSFKAIYIH